jgi:hypothetical protein
MILEDGTNAVGLEAVDGTTDLSFWDALFSPENTTVLAGGITDAIPLVLTGALTLGGTLLTTSLANRSRRKEALALASKTRAEKLEDEQRTERRDNALKWQEDLRATGIETVGVARRMRAASMQLFSLYNLDVDAYPDVLPEREALRATANQAAEELTDLSSAMSVYGPGPVADAALSLSIIARLITGSTDVPDHGGSLRALNTDFDEALNEYLSSLRIALRVDPAEGRPKPEVRTPGLHQ